MVRGRRETLSSQATFVTLSRALCSKGIMALLGISKLPATPESNSFSDPRQREEMIERFKIPQDASMFGEGQICGFCKLNFIVSAVAILNCMVFSVFHGIPLLSKAFIRVLLQDRHNQK